jgi:chromosome segregation ATPase
MQMLVPDEQLIKPVGKKSSPSIGAYVKNVICPYFNVPPDIVAKEGPWKTCVSICSENIYRFARNVLYQRRKSMKSAVELVYSIMKRYGEVENDIKALRLENEQLRKEIAKKDGQINDLEDKLTLTMNTFTKELESAKTKHDIETKESENAYTEFIQSLCTSHRREMDDLRKSMKSTQNIHRTFIDSYVEASLDLLRKSNCDSPTL